jgi:Family of unknown function (DUF5309)
MGVTSGTLETYSSATIREDLADAENMITPTETPFMSMIAGRAKAATNTKHEWIVVALQAVSSSNRVIEGEAAPAVDTVNVAARRGNYTQISDKVVMVSDTSQKIDGAGNVEKLSKQIAYKLKELKRDKETMLLANVAAAVGSSGVARQASGLPAMIITGHSTVGTGGTVGAPGTLTNGFISAAAVNATTNGALTELALNAAIQSAWTRGGDPRHIMVSPTNKRLISRTFVGATGGTIDRNQTERAIINVIDIYESDFGKLKITPNRFQDVEDVFVIDPDHVAISYLQPTRQQALARTGHAESVLISCEYTLEVGNEAAHSIVRDTTG